LDHAVRQSRSTENDDGTARSASCRGLDVHGGELARRTEPADSLLDADVGGRDGQFTALRLNDGTVLRAPAAMVNGEDRVRLGIRPEKLHVLAVADDHTTVDGPDANVIYGTVLDASYIGVSTQYLVETADGHRLTVYAQNLETSGAGEVLADGQRVRLTWKPQHTFVIGPAPSTGPQDDLEPVEEEIHPDA